MVSKIAALALSALAALWITANALPRDRAARSEFIKANPCPTTGKQRGACPGWEVDHITPLKCGGADHPVNMQWLSVQDHRAKTKAESKDCRAKPVKRPRTPRKPSSAPEGH